MSNLIKSAYFNVNPQEVRVIDSDEKVEEYIPEIYEAPHKDGEGGFTSLEFEQFPESFEGNYLSADAAAAKADFLEEVTQEEYRVTIQQAEEEKEKILQEANEEAEAILAKANEEAEAMKEFAKAEGEKLGIEEGRVKITQELEQMRTQLTAEYDAKCLELEEKERNLEPEFAGLVVALVRKLTGVVAENKKDLILYLIGNAIKNLERTKQLVLRVSKRDIGAVSAKKATFQMIAKDVETFDIMEDGSLSENQCIIETDNKIIDCSLDAQLQNLEDHIKMLVN